MMFRPKTTAVIGACLASRCVTAPVEDGLCAQHFNVWVAAGSPPLDTKPAKAPKAPKASVAAGVDVELVKTELEPVRGTLERMLQMAATVPFEHVFAAGQFGAGQTEAITGLEFLGTLREQARLKFAALEDRRTSLTKPLLAVKRGIDELFKPATQQCEAVMRACTDRLTAYERSRMEAIRAAAAQVQLAPADPTVLAIVHGGAAELPSDVRAQPIFVITITDFKAVPDEFKEINQRALQLFVNAKRGQVSIPGVQITQDVKVVTA